MGVIVVGVDGSEGAAIALDFAMKEAELRGSKLRIVSAWEIPASVLASVVAGKEFYEEFRETAVQVAAEAAALIEEEVPSVEHEEIVVEGQAAKALLSNAEDAELMVVGRRGHGSFTEMLLGSISRQVVVHAKCPLVIVPSPQIRKSD
ncbi:MAG: universal stress protein [Actinobacteria bacterium]|nr:universal stress protein [Actinomycetota bacterium]